MNIRDFRSELKSGNADNLFAMLRNLTTVCLDGLCAVSPLNGWPQWHGQRESEVPADGPLLNGWPQWHGRHEVDGPLLNGWPQWHGRHEVDGPLLNGWPQWHGRREIDGPLLNGWPQWHGRREIDGAAGPLALQSA